MNFIPDKPILTGDQILPYIPQRMPMVFVDTFYGTIDDSQYSSLLVTPELIFTENGMLLDIGIIEFLTQSGYVCFPTARKRFWENRIWKSPKAIFAKSKI